MPLPEGNTWETAQSPQIKADLPAVLCRAFNIAQSLTETLQSYLTSTEQSRKQVLHGATQSTSSWLPFSSKPPAAERTEHAVRHDLVSPSVWP